MKRDRHLDDKVMATWVASVGGFTKATLLIQERLECSESKAQKLAAGNYNRLPTASEQIALADLMQRPRDVIYPLAATKGKRSRAS